MHTDQYGGHRRTMKSEIARQLLDLNARFYAECAGSFSATRQRIQPGIVRVMSEWIASRGGYTHSQTLRMLDLGCGNGNLVRWLSGHGFRGWYTGVDRSTELLRHADTGQERITFINADISVPDWLTDLPTQPFDLVTAFAIMHHLPGVGLRVRLLREIKRLLAPDGIFIHSVWQLNNSPRLQKRIQPWEAIGLQTTDMDEGDALLDWRAERGTTATALRYVHTFTESELIELAQKSGFKITESWSSDGKEGCLGLYQVWSRI